LTYQPTKSTASSKSSRLASVLPVLSLYNAHVASVACAKPVKASEKKYGVPMHVQLAIIYQESHFESDARPPREAKPINSLKRITI
jgi:hypothetical protein